MASATLTQMIITQTAHMDVMDAAIKENYDY